MSLDVYLTMPEAPHESITGIYIRRDGRVEEITRAEWDELYPDREPVTATVYSSEVYWRNITHNLAEMAQEADLYEALWRPDARGWTRGQDLIAPLRDGLATLQSDPERFKAFNPANGWGDYEGLLDFVASYLSACITYPNAWITASR